MFQITSMYTCNCATAPTTAGAGVAVGVRGIWSTPNHTVPSQNDCTAVTASNCAGGVTGGTIVVPANTNAKTYWIESATNGSSDDFSTTINWRLLNADCSVISSGQAQTTSAISPANCDG